MIKDNFNGEERKEFLTLRYMAAHAKAIANEWTRRETITEEEANELREINEKLTSVTQKMFDRMCQKEKAIIEKRVKKFDVRYVDDYFLQILNRDLNDKLQNVICPRNDFYIWSEQIMDTTCKNCTRSCNDCNLYDVFDENIVPELDGWAMPNCKYAYK